MSVKLVKVIRTENIGTDHLRVADINGDGQYELILTQNYPMNREVSGITTMDLDGNILWQHLEPGAGGYKGYSDIPVQTIDWDGDGITEVLYVKQAFYKVARMWQYSAGTHIVKEIHHLDEVRYDPDLASEEAVEFEGNAQLVVLDGVTGQIKYTYDIPPSADDAIAFGHFDGTGKWNALVKDRYWNTWAIDNDGKILWHLTAKDMDGGFIGHFPAVGDIDGDGLDEVFHSNTLIDSDGTVLWQVKGTCTHHDAACIIDGIDEKRIIAVGEKVECFSADGKVLWSYDDLGHGQNIVAGRFSQDPKHGPYQFIAEDIQPWAADWHKGCAGIRAKNYDKSLHRVTMYDWNGNIVWEKLEQGTSRHRPIRWTGKGECMTYILPADGKGRRGVAVLDFYGHIVDQVFLVDENGKTVGNGSGAQHPIDILGDSRDELIIYNGEYINIYANTAPYNQRRHYNFTHYNGE